MTGQAPDEGVGGMTRQTNMLVDSLEKSIRITLFSHQAATDAHTAMVPTIKLLNHRKL
jgi:hypothetical protein